MMINRKIWSIKFRNMQIDSQTSIYGVWIQSADMSMMMMTMTAMVMIMVLI